MAGAVKYLPLIPEQSGFFVVFRQVIVYFINHLLDFDVLVN